MLVFKDYGNKGQQSKFKLKYFEVMHKSYLKRQKLFKK